LYQLINQSIINHQSINQSDNQSNRQSIFVCSMLKLIELETLQYIEKAPIFVQFSSGCEYYSFWGII